MLWHTNYAAGIPSPDDSGLQLHPSGSLWAALSEEVGLHPDTSEVKGTSSAIVVRSCFLILRCALGVGAVIGLWW